jgi:hypothetical protein
MKFIVHHPNIVALKNLLYGGVRLLADQRPAVWRGVDEFVSYRVCNVPCQEAY